MYTQHVLEKNEVKLYFKATFLLDISVALNLERVFN